jgi:hypothetical protein
VERKLGGSDGTAGRRDASEALAVSPGVREVRGDPRRVHQQVAQRPVVIGERTDYSSQVLGVRVESAVGAIDHDVVCDELGEVLEAV